MARHLANEPDPILEVLLDKNVALSPYGGEQQAFPIGNLARYRCITCRRFMDYPIQQLLFPLPANGGKEYGLGLSALQRFNLRGIQSVDLVVNSDGRLLGRPNFIENVLYGIDMPRIISIGDIDHPQDEIGVPNFR